MKLFKTNHPNHLSMIQKLRIIAGKDESTNNCGVKDNLKQVNIHLIETIESTKMLQNRYHREKLRNQSSNMVNNQAFACILKNKLESSFEVQAMKCSGIPGQNLHLGCVFSMFQYSNLSPC